MKNLFKCLQFVFYLIAIFIIIFIVCSSNSEGHTEKRFVKINDGYHCTIVYDRKTKVQYAIGDSITVLVDQNGKPLLYEGDEY